MATNEQILSGLKRLQAGDLTVQLPVSSDPTQDEIASTFNQTIRMLNEFAAEVTRIARETGPEGRFGGQAEVPSARGTWKDLVTNINTMSAVLTDSVRDAGNMTRAAASGDFSYKLSYPASGEMQELHTALSRWQNNAVSSAASTP